jgi:membrane protein implicated in regulation of membrane protease activity
MAYRDETERLRARVDELEEELADAHERIAELEEPEEVEHERTFGERFTGAPLRLAVERTLDGELPIEAQEELVEALRKRFNTLGQASSVGRSLTWMGASAQNQRQIEVSVSARNGHTTIRVMERLSNLAGGLFGGIVGGLGGGGLGLWVPLLALAKATFWLPVLILGWILLVYLIVRAIYVRVAAKKQAELAATASELARLGREAIGRAGQRKRKRKRKRLRVKDQPSDDEREAEAEEAERDAEEDDEAESVERARRMR